jgi:Ca-activated chloride channel family protein
MIRDAKKIEVTASWDKNVVPANQPKKRGLLVDISGIGKKHYERHAVNLSLVIDRSGSMGGGRLEAAIQAATGVIERLEAGDVLSVVDFDDQISTLVKGLKMTEAGKEEAIATIERLHSRGTTDLGGGWFQGAQHAAWVMETMNFRSGHVVLLSDGHANQGMQDPKELHKHASEMANRGVTTSTVGIGGGYSPLQLEALAEGGLGRLHDAETPEHIIETILGELGEVVSVVATNVELTLRWPAMLRSELVSNFDVMNNGNSMTVRLGQLVAGSRRTVPFIIDVPAMQEGETALVEAIVEGRNPETGNRLEAVAIRTELTAVPPADARAAERNRRVAERIARLWENTLGLDAMRLNERGDYAGARQLLDNSVGLVANFAKGTGAEREIRRRLDGVADRVTHQWDGRSKRAAMMAAKKFSKNERDHRSGDWDDYSDHV